MFTTVKAQKALALWHGAELCYAPDALRGYVVVLLVVSGEMIIFENIGVGWGLAPTFYFADFSPYFKWGLNFVMPRCFAWVCCFAFCFCLRLRVKTAGASHQPYDNIAELSFMSIIMNYEL
ncbi:MAG: hypothetical protein IJJ76_08500 [Ruminococcus sp.]|uniref:hypothetical protein n=1 Tax=Ruminococcus sp. TaxID=41978 RepID=UPI0025F410E9|nr:hypothetical protein [Ruminococcus sp.]MBR0529787.1 hypothetical protein [Ruminococcus sp.]